MSVRPGLPVMFQKKNKRLVHFENKTNILYTHKIFVEVGRKFIVNFFSNIYSFNFIFEVLTEKEIRAAKLAAALATLDMDAI
jgi:hypothetical protein